jgi:hypothetical protein
LPVALEVDQQLMPQPLKTPQYNSVGMHKQMTLTAKFQRVAVKSNKKKIMFTKKNNNIKKNEHSSEGMFRSSDDTHTGSV